MFELNARTEVRMTFDPPSGGKEVEVIHHFRNPKAKEWKDYEKGRLAGAQTKLRSHGEGKEKETESEIVMNLSDMSAMDAAEQLWNATCEKVEGYSEDGEAIDCTEQGWKEKIFLPHKVAAVTKLVEIYDSRREKN